MFLAKGIFRDCELDMFNEGCMQGTGYSLSWDVDFSSNTLKDLIKEIADYHNINENDIVIENGKIDIQVHEIQLYDRWINPSKEDFEKWKKEEQELYLVEYSYNVYQGVN